MTCDEPVIDTVNDTALNRTRKFGRQTCCLMSDRQSKVAVCHGGVALDRGQTRNKMNVSSLEGGAVMMSEQNGDSTRCD